MKKITLVIMAAGIGSRFGGGIKQLEPVGPNGETIMDYSIIDAMKAGFNKIVFVIRKNLEEDFKEMIGNRIEKKVEVAYVYQEVDNIPQKYKEKFNGRTKPWGTGQAIHCCRGVVNEPFLTINADDYYGVTAYQKAYAYLAGMEKGEQLSACMIGFVLENTLSETGGVTRGVCKVNEESILLDIVETPNICKMPLGVCVESNGKYKEIEGKAKVSMNMWGLSPDIFEVLQDGFESFLDKLEDEDKKTEYLFPVIVGDLLAEKRIKVKVLESKDKWFGVTYKEDKEFVLNAIKEMMGQGMYEGVI